MKHYSCFSELSLTENLQIIPRSIESSTGGSIREIQAAFVPASIQLTYIGQIHRTLAIFGKFRHQRYPAWIFWRCIHLPVTPGEYWFVLKEKSNAVSFGNSWSNKLYIFISCLPFCGMSYEYDLGHFRITCQFTPRDSGCTQPHDNGFFLIKDWLMASLLVKRLFKMYCKRDT